MSVPHSVMNRWTRTFGWSLLLAAPGIAGTASAKFTGLG